MGPSHHLSDELLAAYATGACSPAFEVLVATHLTLCVRCRAVAQQWEAVGAAVLESSVASAESAVEPAWLDALMARLDEPEPPSVPQRFDPAGVIPSPLFSLCGPLNAQRWRWSGPGVQTADLIGRTQGLPLRIVKMKAGISVPAHDHSGDERAVVLAGGWTDEFGDFERGDFCFVPATAKDHRQVVHGGEDCVALVLNDAPVNPKNPVLRLLQRFVKV